MLGVGRLSQQTFISNAYLSILTPTPFVVLMPIQIIELLIKVEYFNKMPKLY